METLPVNTVPKTLLAFFWHIVKDHWKWILAIQLLCFGWSIDHTLWPGVLMLVVDALTNFQGDREQVWSVLKTPVILGALLWILVEITYRLAGFLLAYVTPKLEAAIRMSMFDYVTRHSYVYFSKQFAGGMANKISDMTQSFTQIMKLLLTLFMPVALALIISVALFAKVQLVFAMILAGWLVVHIGICLACAKKCDWYSNIHAEARSGLAGSIVDCLSNNLNVRLFGRYKYEHDYLAKQQKDEVIKHEKSLVYIEKMKIALGLTTFLGAGVAMNWYMLYAWQKGMISTGEVVFIFNTTWNITIMAWLAGLELPTLFKEIGVCRQALTIIQDEHDLVDEPSAVPLNVKKGEIAFENVTFHYIPNHNIFEDKNITLDAGSKVGLVGFSGSGKSTFVHLILRYFDVEQGRILIDGQDISQVSQETLRSQIAMIPQDTSLFHRSLMDNIRYGRLDATDEEVIEAAKKAHCHEFIEKMPEKYHTTAGERGVKLSGGQRQRIAIARAILKNAPILILDEATSALDSVTEQKIQEGIELLTAGRTCIFIAHRLSTLSGMDRILVFKDGKIIEDGTHEELLNADGHYAHMWNMQAGGFLPDTLD